MRTSREEWFLDIAERCAMQGTCVRRKFGAVLVDRNNTIISTGYNGAPVGQDDCTVLRCWREENNIPSGSNYEKCRSVHAEMNALLQAGEDANGSVMYVAGVSSVNGECVPAEPCFLCCKLMVNAGVKRIVIRTPDGNKMYDPERLYWIREAEVLG